MIKTPKAALQILMVCFAGAPAFAHSPYVRGETPWISPDGRQLAVGMLYGDGIFLADPARPVILDEQRRVLAMGPLSHDGFVSCASPTECKVLLGFSRGASTVVPDPAGFREPRSDLFYPEHEKEEYGFRPLPSTPEDEWVRWTSIYRRHPLQAFICTIFFGVYGYAAVAFPFRLKQLVNRRLRSGAVRVVALAGGSIAAVLAPLMFAAGLLFINMMYGGTELTLLPGPVGFGLGALCGVLVWLWPVKANGMARR